MRLGEKGRFRYAPALLLPQILNNFTSNYWPGFTPPQWPGFTPPLTLHFQIDLFAFLVFGGL